MAERVELLLRQASNLGLHTRAACVEYLGNLFRSALDAPPRKTDFQVGGRGCLHNRRSSGGDSGSAAAARERHRGVLRPPALLHICRPFRQALLRPPPPPLNAAQVGEQLLRELLFIHLEAPADKLALAVQMLLKLFALVSSLWQPTAHHGSRHQHVGPAVHCECVRQDEGLGWWSVGPGGAAQP